MIRLSDLIEQFIKQMLENNGESEIQIQRNELANHFSCAPSQINYVLTTRFSTDKGYYIESRRGGGGCILIRRIEFNQHQSLVDAINDKIKDNITYDGAAQIIHRLFESDYITEREALIMKLAINDRTLGAVENKNKARADILKSMILVIVS